MRLIICIVFLICILVACSDPVEEIIAGYQQVEKNIEALAGGSLLTPDSVLLSIPPDALPFDGMVFLGRTGSEPASVPNPNIVIAGDPITVKFPASYILKPVRLRIPFFSNFADTSNYFVLLFDGTSYFPMAYTIQDGAMHITIDRIDWASKDTKNVNLTSEFIILLAKFKQTIPEKEMGLKEVGINSISNEITYGNPSANASSRILLLIHGWTASPAKWNDFLPRFIADTSLPYTAYWTFGYNSSLSIPYNGELLSQLLYNYANGARIDILAHSMGGLVARSAIETFEGSAHINRLITLGSPHEGSPLAVFRYALGALVQEDNPDATLAYNYNTQGFRDLDTSSAFIQEMKLMTDPPLPYYTIAVTNDPGQSLFSQISSQHILKGPDDGIVTVESAHGVTGAASPDQDISIPTAWAHMKLPVDNAVFEQVTMLLR